MPTEVINIQTLRTDLITLYNDFRNGSITASVAKDAANIAGKIIHAAKVELTYKMYKTEIEKIDFLD